jgi:pSer/pThr/pTyr-binding forkhead associated (FHA) protein
MRWSEVRPRLLPRSGVGVVAPWLVIALPGNSVIRLDLRVLDRVRVRSEEADEDEQAGEAGDPVVAPPRDRRCGLVLSCHDLDVCIHIADGPEAAERLFQEAAPFTRENTGTKNTLLVNTADAGVPAEPPPTNGRLVVLESELAGKEFELDRPNMTIGRSDENDIIIKHRSISRAHARLTRDPASHRYTITDLDATNKVRVNGQDCKTVQLHHDDIVDLGHVRMRFVDPSADFVISCDAPLDPANVIIVGGDVVHRTHAKYIQVGSLSFHLDQVADHARQGADLRLPNGSRLQAAMAMLVVAANERDKAPT